MTENDYVAGGRARSDSSKLVVLSGCSGAGKSTLVAELAARGYPTVPEPGRQVVKEQLSIGADGLPWDNWVKFIELCVSRGMHAYNQARPHGKPVIFDRSIVDAATAFRGAGVPEPPWAAQALSVYRYAKRVFMVPPWKELFGTDTERRHTFEDAVKEYEHLLTAYRDNGYQVVLVPRGSVSERASFLEAELEKEDLAHA